MGKINSRTKGHSFERLVANLLKPYYPQARRGLQYQDGAQCPDVIGTDFHVECKRGKKTNIRKAFEQAHRDAKPELQNSILIVSQEDHKPITVSMEFTMFKRLLHSFLDDRKEWNQTHREEE